MAKRGRSVRFVVSGHREIDRKLRKLAPKLQKSIARKAIRRAMKPILTEIIRLAPRDSGEMASGIKLRAAKRKKRGSIALEIRTDGPGGYRAVFQEYGTSRYPARPFMRPAFERHKDSARKQILQEIWSEIKKNLK